MKPSVAQLDQPSGFQSYSPLDPVDRDNVAALPMGAEPGLYGRHVGHVRASDLADSVKLAFEFLVLTAARWGEVRWARWTEMDTTAHVWTVPATRMKANREHRAPLCRRAVEILDAARTLGDGDGRLVFAVGDGEPLEERVLRRRLERRRVPAVPHGFRSSFRDWAAERTDHSREVIEAALAHVVRNKVEAVVYGGLHVTGGVTTGVTGPVTESRPSSQSLARHHRCNLRQGRALHRAALRRY